MVCVGGAHPLPGAYEPVRIPKTVQEDDSEGLARTFERVALPILIISALLTISLVGSLISDPPEFHTDLADFAPDGPSKEAADRAAASFGNESKVLFIHVTAEDGGNVLSMDHIQEQRRVLHSLKENLSEPDLESIERWLTTPDALQTALDDRGEGVELSSITSWADLLDAADGQNLSCLDDPDEQARDARTFAASSLLHKDLDVGTTCSWIEGDDVDPTPSAQSLLWVLTIDSSLDGEARGELHDRIRTEFNRGPASQLSFEAFSIDLLSHDIDAATFANLWLLVTLGGAVVVVLLAIAFRSPRGVLFPMVGLSSALIWTFGFVNLVTTRMTALEVAVAPLVLGLGIDYSIHLQREYASERSNARSPASAWVAACRRLWIPIGLGVVTTVAAFLANVISDLDPIRSFGIALSFGVISAFLNAVFVVGALHVLFDRDEADSVAPELRFPRLTSSIVTLQSRNTAIVILLALLISFGSVVGASRLETEFELSDFLDEDLEVMQVRSDLQSSYTSANWRPVTVLLEPLEGATHIPHDAELLEAMEEMHDALEQQPDVVGAREDAPSYDGPYVVLRDALLRDPTFGDLHNLEVTRGVVHVLNESRPLDLHAAFQALASNETVADPLDGRSWATRVEGSVDLDDTGIVRMRMEVRVTAITSQDASRLVGVFESTVLGTGDGVGARGSFSDHATLTVTGDLVLLDEVLNGLTESQLRSTALSLLFAAAVLGLLTRRLISTVVVLIPVGLSSLWVIGSMALLGMSWNVLTVMVTALTIGIGIDYAIHIWRRFEDESNHTSNQGWRPVEATLETTGVAILMSALTTILGFAVLMLSPMPLIADFGLITAVTVMFALILCTILLPLLLMVVESDRLPDASD